MGRTRVVNGQQRTATDSGLKRPHSSPATLGTLPPASLRRKVRALAGAAFRRLRAHISVPRPTCLPWGGWLLGWGDFMEGALRHGFEQQEQSFLLEFLRPGMTFLDIGAHHGLYSLLASKKVDPGGIVVAFEPSPREFRRLQWNLALNRCRNVRAARFALGMTDGTAQFFMCLGHDTGCNSLRPPAATDPIRRITVPITSLDRYLAQAKIEAGDIDVMKLDVEGAELDVLKGAPGVLSSARPLILCELVDIRTAPWGYRSQAIYAFLAASGYRWFSFAPRARLHPALIAEQFNENLLAVPDEKLHLVADFVEEVDDRWNEQP